MTTTPPEPPAAYHQPVYQTTYQQPDPAIAEIRADVAAMRKSVETIKNIFSLLVAIWLVVIVAAMMLGG